MMYKEKVPTPTPRTMASPSGFACWIEWAEETEKTLQEKGKSFYEYYNSVPLIGGYVIKFDHKAWSKYGDLCLYCTDRFNPNYLDILPFAEVGKRKVKATYLQPTARRE